MQALATALRVVILIAALVPADSRPRGAPARPYPRWTPLFVLIAAAGLLAQLQWPGLRPLLERNADAMFDGQWWRLFTALWPQDGGIAGGLANIASLLLIGNAAERRWPGLAWPVLYLGGGLLSQLVALRWQPVGAGNSVAVMALAGALICARFFDGPSKRWSSVAAAACACALIGLCDIHGAATLIGCLFAWAARRR
ncbi:MAG TPA: rhomboid family intramembrane serine protease [Burkholderiales bacterium]|jgi:rhomboid protease GluP